MRRVCITAVFALCLQDCTCAQNQQESGYRDGFFFRSADGHHEIVLEGLFQVGLNAFQADRGRDTEFDLRRIRPELAGRFAKVIRFRIEPKFSEDEVELEEAWVGADLWGGDARLMLGRMKVPFNLEEVRSRRHIDFPRFSIINQFAPAEDQGVFLNGRPSDGLWEYGLAIYNGTGEDDSNSSEDFAGRIMLHPFAYEEGSVLHNLQIGAAFLWGRESEAVGTDSISNAADQPVVDFAPGTRLDGTRAGYGLEFAWFDGPFMVQSEWMLMRQEMNRMGVGDRVQFHGGYVNAAWVLTGESKSFGGVEPDNPIDLAGGSLHGGAWILATRLSDLRADSSLRDLGLTAPNRFTRHIRSISVGLNWVLNQHVIVRHSYVHSFYSDDVMLGTRMRDNEGALMIEWQMHF